MKKFLQILLVVLLAISLVFLIGCGKGKKKALTDKSLDEIVVGFSQIGAESAWRTANTESIISEAKARGIELKFSDAQQKQENQIKAIRSFIAQGVDIIGFTAVVESGWGPVLREAKEAGIPVVLIDRGVDEKDESLWVSWMGSDFVAEGVKAGKWVVDNVKPKPGKKTVSIVELQGTVGSAPANDRFKGFRDGLNNNPAYVITKTQSADFTRAKGKEVMEAFLKADGKNIDVLFAHNDDSALGAIQAIEEYGLKPGKDIIVVSIDAVRGAFEAMVEGKLNVTVECSPLLGPQFFDAVEALVKGETLPRKIWTKEGVFEMANAEADLPTRKY